MPSLLVIGGARSGKSRYALMRAEASGLQPIFIATARADDAEMQDRIARHQAERGPRWQSIEAPIDLAGCIHKHDAADHVLLIDCLTLWATNLMLAELDIEQASAGLMAAIQQAKGQIILVSNEVGWGIVPDNALARAFRDVAGRLNQQIAATVDEVRLVCAGLDLRLK